MKRREDGRVQVDRDTQNFLDTTNGGDAVVLIRNRDGSITMARLTDVHLSSSVGDSWAYASVGGHLAGSIRGADEDGSTLPGIMLDAAARVLRPYLSIVDEDPELPGAGATIAHWYRVVDLVTGKVMAESSDPEEIARIGARDEHVRFEQLRIRTLYEPWSRWTPDPVETDDDTTAS